MISSILYRHTSFCISAPTLFIISSLGTFVYLTPITSFQVNDENYIERTV